MAKHIVKCKYCGIQFDANLEPFEVENRRYSHKACYDKAQSVIPQSEKDYAELEKYIKKLFKIDNVGIRIKKQIMEYHQTYNYTYSGILKSLIWWYDIQKHSIAESGGAIGIVPYIYDDACKYYYSI